MVNPFFASAAAAFAFDGARIHGIYDKNMKNLRKDYKHSEDNL